MAELPVGHLIMAGFLGTEPPAGILERVRTGRLGGVVLLGRNVINPEQVRALTTALQEAAREGGQPPIFIAIDHEGGTVQRLRNGVTRMPSQMAMAVQGDTALAHDLYLQHARELQAMGINVNFAPVLDVNNNPANPVIGTRAFAAQVDRVSAFGVVAVRAWLEGGVIPCGKHFPGHGDTDQDSHLTLPTVPHDMERLRAIELEPFRQAIQAGLPSIMTAHVRFPAVEPSGVPATLSYQVLTKLLRDDLGFDGVIITDALEMQAIDATVGAIRGAVEAVRAGADLCLFGHAHYDGAYHALGEAVAAGELPRARVEDALRRLERLREFLRPLAPLVAADPALEQRAYAQAIRVEGRQDLLPLRKPPLVISFEAQAKTGAEDTESRVASLLQGLEEARIPVTHRRLPLNPDPGQVSDTLSQVGGRAVIVVTDHAVTRAGQAALVQAVPDSVPLYLVALSNPVDLKLIAGRSQAVGVTLSDPTADAQTWMARTLAG